MPVHSDHDPARRWRSSRRTLLGALVLACVLAVAATLAALATGGGPAAPGTVTGVVVTGPLIPVDPGSPVGWMPTPAEVLAYRIGADTPVASSHSGADGRFSLTLAAGRYRLTARISGAGARASARPVTVTVTAGGTEKTRIWLDTGVRFSAHQGVVCTAPAQGGQGISGSVRIGPTRPASTPGQSDTKPYAARISIYHLDGAPAATITSDKHGVFSTSLPAGGYVVEPGARGPLFPRAQPFSITIQRGQWRCVTIAYDSGIR
jgi:hypothetical protein